MAASPPSASPASPPSAASVNRRRLALEEQRRAFLRLVSHELRTPLNAIIGFSEVISRELHGPINEPKYREHADVIHESGLKLLRLVNQVLELARLEAGAAELTLGPEPVEALLHRVVRAVQEEARLREVSLAVEVEPGAAYIWADEKGLQTALVNLVQNAVAFSPRGAEVTLHASASGSVTVIQVQDRGSGLNGADVNRLMRPFEQGEHALVRRGEGAGLGLPTARLLCEAMCGTLSLTPREGGGVVAAIRLPTAAAPHREGRTA